MNQISNFVSVFVARRRWLKKPLRPILPKKAYYKMKNGLNFYFDPRDLKGPSYQFSYNLERGFENFERESKEELLSRIPENGVFFDIGANIGMYSLFIAHQRKDISLFCFEPERTVFECLKSSFDHLNRTNICLFNYAVGSSHQRKKRAALINIDELYSQGKILRPDAIKINVEGYELAVLESMCELIQKEKPVMLIECNNEDLSAKDEFWNYIYCNLSIDYQVKVPGEKKLMTIDQLPDYAKFKLDDCEMLTNYLFIPMASLI